MKHLLVLLIALAFCGRIIAATGDYLGVNVEADGKELTITVEGFAPGATYDFGYTGINQVSADTPYITVLSEGYTGSTLGTRLRTIYLRRVIRKVYPNQAQLNEFATGGNLVTRFVLSDYIYADDTDLKFYAPAGFIVNTAGGAQSSAAASAMAVTSDSAAPYQPCVANWAGGVEWNRMTGSTIRLRVWAFHGSGQEGRPVQAIVGTVTQGANTETATVTTMSMDLTQQDELPTAEYLIDVPTTSLTQGATCTANITVYPWIGDATSVLSSSAGAAAPTPLLGPITFVCDKSGTYERTFVTVDDDAADDTSGVAVNRADYASDTLAEAGTTDCKTIGKAASIAAAYNNTTHGRNDVGAVEVCLAAGTYAWLGSSNSYGTTPACRVIIRPKTGVSRENVIIATASGNGDISDRIEIRDCTITVSTVNTFTNITDILFTGCHFNTSGTGIFNTTGGVFSLAQCDLTRLDQGLRPVSVVNCRPKLIRGCTGNGFNKGILAYTVAGNRFNTFGDGRIFDSGFGAPVPSAVIFNNQFLSCITTGAEVMQIGNSAGNLLGAAVVQNVVEGISGSDAMTPTAGTAVIGAGDFDYNNYIIWNNVFLGDRTLMGYNDEGIVAYYRRYWSEKHNYYDRWANKGDEFGTGNANRIGGWAVKFGTGRRGCYLSQNNSSIPGNFYAEDNGLETWEPDEAANGLATDALFTNRQSSVANGASYLTAGSGGGTYTILAGSPLDNLSEHFAVPYDMAGRDRTTANNAAGAYAAAGTVHSNKGLKLFIRRK
jgi:hypothetical protein